MRDSLFITAFVLCSGIAFAAPPASQPMMTIAYPWLPDQGDGTYRNPIICADYSDPDVVRVGDDYWMTASSFNHVPGLPILHSRDLVNWTLVNYALPALVPAETRSSGSATLSGQDHRFRGGLPFGFFPSSAVFWSSGFGRGGGLG